MMAELAGTIDDARVHGSGNARRQSARLDANTSAEERLPAQITMVFKERMIGGVKHVSQSWNGINIGDSLTDNRTVEDGYRFHDVFHLAYYALLGWSPVLRLLLSLKRKSQPAVEESQDGLRAVLIEEAVSIFVFTQAKALQYFKDTSSLDAGLLSTVQAMVAGYEVESRETREWEAAILAGYAAFRALKNNAGGVIVASLDRGTLSYHSHES